MFKRVLYQILTLLLLMNFSCLYCKADEAAMLKEANSYIVKDHAKAIELYKKVLEINPKSDEANYNIGALYLFDNQPEKSLPYFQTTLNYNPKYVLAYSAIAVNCDVLADYQLTNTYIKLMKSEFKDDKTCLGLADKFKKTSDSKHEYSDRLISKVIPSVKMDVTAPKWVLAYRLNNPKMAFSQLIVRDKKINTTPEALSFYELKGIANHFISPQAFAISYVQSLRKKHSGSIYNYIESSKGYVIFEIANSDGYELYKCLLGKNSVYMVSYNSKNADIYPEKRQYWINQFKKIQFIE